MKTKTKIPLEYNLVIRGQKKSKTMAKHSCNTFVINTVLFICSNSQLQLLSFTANNKSDSKTNFFDIPSYAVNKGGERISDDIEKHSLPTK